MSNFDGFEERLKREMERVPAPEGFADRVMSRVADEKRIVAMPKRAAWNAMRMPMRMAVAAMLLVGIVIGGWQWRQQQELRKEREQAEVVQRQFDLAMQVTQKTLVEVQQRVGRTVRDSVRQ